MNNQEQYNELLNLINNLANRISLIEERSIQRGKKVDEMFGKVEEVYKLFSGISFVTKVVIGIGGLGMFIGSAYLMIKNIFLNGQN